MNNYLQRNGSTEFDGHSNVATGIDSIANLGKLKMWNYKDKTRFYQSPCSAVEGSSGEFWPPYRTKDDIQYFSADICRFVNYHKSKYEIRQGSIARVMNIHQKIEFNNSA